MNELSLINELDKIKNKFILFVKMVPIIHWSGSPKKWLQKSMVMVKGIFE
jgi:hypothetical protein